VADSPWAATLHDPTHWATDDLLAQRRENGLIEGMLGRAGRPRDRCWRQVRPATVACSVLWKSSSDAESAGLHASRQRRVAVSLLRARSPAPTGCASAFALRGRPVARQRAPDVHRRTVGSPMRRQTAVARYARGEHRRTNSAQELRPQGSRRSRTATRARARPGKDGDRAGGGGHVLRRSLRSLRSVIRRQDPPATDCGPTERCPTS